MAEPTEVEQDGRVTRRPVQLTPMQVPKASDVLADDLRERILRGSSPRAPRCRPSASSWRRPG